MCKWVSVDALCVLCVQLGDAERGFSFSQCGPLDMRMDPSQSTTAADLVNQFTEEQLSNCLLKVCAYTSVYV